MTFRLAAVFFLLLSLAAMTLPPARAAQSLSLEDPAWLSFDKGIEMLEQGAPRADVLAQWDHSLREYPHSPYQHQLAVYTTVLRQQVTEDQRRAVSPLLDPSALPLSQRVQYDLDHFPDIHGTQIFQPGICFALGQGDGTKFSDAVVKIGRPALTSLIAHLNDTRLTRSIGFWRDFAPFRTVLRVQDVAMQCIESITHIRFMPSFNYFADMPPRQQAKMVSELRAWWQANQNKSPVQWLVSRLSIGSVTERLDVLQHIKRMNPRAVDECVWLTRWKRLASDNEVPDLAMALAPYGDFTLRPRVRRLMRDPNVGPWSCTSYLLCYGNVSDCRYIHQQALADLAENRSLGTSRILADITRSFSPDEVHNPLAVPAYVDLLSYRSHGDLWGIFRCLQTLAALTGHTETRRRDREPDWQPAAARWLTWWQAGGKAQYLAHHPDVRRVLRPS